MLKNYFKIAWRNLVRSKGFSVINLSGLAIGMASAMLIILWAQNEISYDRFYSKADRIYKLYSRDKLNGEVQVSGQSPTALAVTLKQDYPDVEDAVRYRGVNFLTTAGENHINARGAFADSNFLSVFDLPLLEGNPLTSLNRNYSIVLTRQMAKKLFGNEDVVGKTVRIDSTDNFTVTAVLKDLPPNTQFDFEYLLPWSYMIQLGWDDGKNWVFNLSDTYTSLKKGASQKSFDKKIKNIIISHLKASESESRPEVFTQPLRRLYLYSRAENGHLVAGRIEMVRLFLIIAIFILLIACINFMNLSTARSEKRAKEVGIRKVMGAFKTSLVLQFISESILLTLLGFIIAAIIVLLSLPAFDQLTGKQLSVNFEDPFSWVVAIAFILCTGFIAGSYPAFYLSSFAPVKVFKGSFKKINTLITPRKLLVILQFTFAIILIICTIIVREQVRLAQQRDAGYNKNDLIYTFAQGDVNKHFELIKQDLLRSGAAMAVTKSFSPITKRWNDGSGFQWQGSTEADKKTDFVWFGSDADFVKTIGVKLVSGRDIDVYKYPTDSMAMLLNEEAVKAMGIKNPIGHTITFIPDGRQWHVIGVVKDFILESPYEKINPMMIVGPSQFFQVVHIRLNPANTAAVDLAKANEIFKQYNPQYPFEYVFADESYAKKFNDEKRTETLARLFAALTIFISCLGLLGLSAYMAENRTKEIGIRKVLGATPANISLLLSKDFLKLIIISVVVASPVAMFAMNKWLSNYQYRTTINWWVFVGSGLLVIIIALITISFQAIKAAIANPVKSLRTE
jgi:putative ABC transport system permease protein